MHHVSRGPNRSRACWVWQVLLLLILLGSSAVLPLRPAAAQSDEWAELSTTYFTILYPPDETGRLEAEAYAGFVDQIYDEIATLFEYRAATPLILRLFPSFESYQAVNPLARDIPGIVAHADFRKRELAVVLPRTEQQSPDEIQNNIRHELTHIFAADLSNNQLNTGFQEGIAQYVEIPTGEYTRKLELIQQALASNRLIRWSDLQERERIYNEPQIGYPQSLSIVTFLIENYGFRTFRTFIEETGRSTGYRAALQSVYRTSPSELEAQWRAWLPSFVDGTYVTRPAIGFDLNYPIRLLEQGRYAEAQSELEATIEWLRTTPQQDTLQEAEALLIRSRAGQQATQIALSARTALANGEYEQALNLTQQARQAFAAIGDTRQEQVLEVYAARAIRGLRANQQLATASSQLESFRFWDARDAAERAAQEYARLGDTQRAEQALALRDSLSDWQRLAGVGLVVLGVLSLLASLWGRWLLNDQEVW